MTVDFWWNLKERSCLKNQYKYINSNYCSIVFIYLINSVCIFVTNTFFMRAGFNFSQQSNNCLHLLDCLMLMLQFLWSTHKLISDVKLVQSSKSLRQNWNQLKDREQRESNLFKIYLFTVIHVWFPTLKSMYLSNFRANINKSSCEELDFVFANLPLTIWNWKLSKLIQTNNLHAYSNIILHFL